jgi:drug/metabolite transporter (DMT)-like permease
VIAVVIGCLLFGEKVDWGDATGMTLMLGAAFLALRPGAPRPAVGAAAAEPA